METHLKPAEPTVKSQPEPIADAVPDAAARMGISTSFTWEKIAAGEIGSVKIGRRRLITREEQKRFLEKHAVSVIPRAA